MFRWLRNRRRKQLLQEPFPKHWQAILLRNVEHYSRLNPQEQSRLRDITRILFHEKRWEAARGFSVTEEMKLTIAAQAALLLIGFTEPDYYERVPSIVVHPTEFRRPDPDDPTLEDDVSEQIVDGLADYRGPVVVAWNLVLEEGQQPQHGQNVVLHEFAHQLDFRDNSINGTPPLQTPELEREWSRVMTAALEHHRQDVEKFGEETFFTEHAAEDETEFFADVVEAFYCVPELLITENREVYQLMKNYFQVDPVLWFPDRGN
jgi:MtfA peptidase